MKQEIEKRLQAWFGVITEAYSWLTVRYEFCETLNVFLVGLYPTEIIEKDDEFCLEVLTFADEMNRLYGDNAPLFGFEETCFKFSEKSIVYGSQSCENLIKHEFMMADFYVENQDYSYEILGDGSYDEYDEYELNFAA